MLSFSIRRMFKMKKINFIIACSAILLLAAACTGCGDTETPSDTPASVPSHTETAIQTTTADATPTTEALTELTEPEATEPADILSLIHISEPTRPY